MLYDLFKLILRTYNDNYINGSKLYAFELKMTRKGKRKLSGSANNVLSVC